MGDLCAMRATNRFVQAVGKVLDKKLAEKFVGKRIKQAYVSNEDVHRVRLMLELEDGEIVDAFAVAEFTGFGPVDGLDIDESVISVREVSKAYKKAGLRDHL